MPLELPPNFKNDIQGRDTNLVPVVVIGGWTINAAGLKMFPLSNFYLSTNSINLSTHTGWTSNENVYSPTYSTIHYKPILLNIPSLKESIDIEKRNYKISSINIDISNFPYEGVRFSEIGGNPSLINWDCWIFWVSPSVDKILAIGYDSLIPPYNSTHEVEALPPEYAFQIYAGKIRRYTHDDEKVRLVVEDRSQATLHKDLPLEKHYLEGADVPDKYKNKPIPMVYGHVDRSPCVIGSADSIIEENGASFKILIDSKEISSVVHTKPLANAPDPKGFLFIYLNNHYYRVLNDNTDVSGSFGSGAQAQILDEDIQLPDTNGYSSVNMVARFDHEQAMNNLAKNSIVVDIGRIPNSTNPYLIKLSDTDPGGGDPADGSNLNLISGELTNMYDMDGSSLVNVARHNVPSTNSASDFRGMGFRFGFDSLGIDSEIMPDHFGNLTAFRIFTKFKFGCWGGELNFHWYNGTERKTFLQYNYGDSGYEEYLIIDNLFTGATLDGDPPGTFDATGGIENTSDFNYHQFTWQDVNIDDPISFYQLSSLYTDDVNFDWDIYGFAVHAGFLIKEPQGRDFYANVNGRLVSSVDGIVLDDNVAPHTIGHILENELGVAGSQADGWTAHVNSGYPIAPTDRWTYAFTIDKKINSKKLLEGIASASPYIPRFDNMGKFKFDVIPMDGGSITSDDHIIKEVDVIDFSFSRTKIEDVCTKVVFRYNWDYARGEFNDSVEAEVGESGDFITNYVFDYYGFPAVTSDGEHLESTVTIDDDRGKYIRDHYTAQDFADWYLMWNANQHLKMKIKLPLKYMNLEIGDMVKISTPEDGVLGGVKPYGIDYTNQGSVNFQTVYQTFLITSTNKTLEWVEVECIQMHNLDVNRGCTDPDACNYDEAALADDGSCLSNDCTYDPNDDSTWEGACGGTAEEDCCGDCNGTIQNCEEGCDVCGTTGEVLDECGVCGGNNSSCLDCAGVPNGNAEFDNCGVCGGENADCIQACDENWYDVGRDPYPVPDDCVGECVDGICEGGGNDGVSCNNNDECPGICGGDGSTCMQCPDDGIVTLWGVDYDVATTTSISLENQGLSGSIPLEIGCLTNLTYLSLSHNQLSGEIPSSIGDLTNLSSLRLRDNQLIGEIPIEIGNLTNLTSLHLADNQLTGEIPSEIGNLTNLTYLLYLHNNQLTGEIPPEIGNLTNLNQLWLKNNQLSGEIPSEICNQGDSSPSLQNNQLCPPYPDCGDGEVTSEEEQDTELCEVLDSLPGDINGDGNINVLDIVGIVNCILADDCGENADLSEDGSVNVLDIVQLVNYILDNV